MKRFRLMLIGLAAAVVAALALIASQGASTSTGAERPGDPSVFNDGASAAAVLPAGLEAGGYDVDSARVGLTTDDGTTVVAIKRTVPQLIGRGGDMLCVLTVAQAKPGEARAAAAGGCGTAEEMNTTGLISTTGSGISGLVPDGVNEVTVGLANGDRQAVKVTNNAFALDAKSATATVTFTGPAGEVTVDTPSAPEG